jgi:hypothetical protein
MMTTAAGAEVASNLFKAVCSVDFDGTTLASAPVWLAK